MKRAILLAITITVISCTHQIKDFGKIELENGSGKKVPVTYYISKDDLPELQKQLPDDDFVIMLSVASSKAKQMCNHMNTYEPKSISIKLSHDTIVTTVSFDAKNSFGVSDGSRAYLWFKGKNYIGSF